MLIVKMSEPYSTNIEAQMKAFIKVSLKKTVAVMPLSKPRSLGMADSLILRAFLVARAALLPKVSPS